MIEVDAVTYEYPGKCALKEVSFAIPQGSVTALVGPNGAGKTTLMRCLAALDKPFSGAIRIGGVDAVEHPREIHQMIGYLSDFFGLYDDLTVRQSLTYAGALHAIPEAEIPARVEKTARRLGLGQYLDTASGALSRGLRQRLGIAQAFIHEPKILLLDEPASGLDPEARLSLSKLFLELRDEGVTLIVSSHILSELEDYCTDMLLLRDGALVEHTAAKAVSAEEAGIMLAVQFTEPAESFMALVESHASVSGLSCEAQVMHCTFTGGPEELQALLSHLVKKKAPVCGFTPSKRRLQDIYMAHLPTQMEKGDAA